MAQYYVIRDKNTGLYFRGKGVNRWGKHYNQASIYRIKANAENTIKEVSWRGEQAEIVPIQIVETTEDVVPKSEVEYYKQLLNEECDACIDRARKKVAREIFEEIEKDGKYAISFVENHKSYSEEVRQAKLECYKDIQNYIVELKKKYTESEDNI